jgi:hypothetical protein
MSQTFASTCAVIFPVFALAAIAELGILSRIVREWLSNVKSWRDVASWWLLILTGVLSYGIWAWVTLRMVDAELLCLDRLREIPVPNSSASTVRGTVDAAMTLLIALPVLGIPLLWMIGVANQISKARSLKRRPSFLDDEVELDVSRPGHEPISRPDLRGDCAGSNFDADAHGRSIGRSVGSFRAVLSKQIPRSLKRLYLHQRGGDSASNEPATEEKSSD